MGTDLRTFERYNAPLTVTILAFADTRFPIERANGLQTMATCRALAARGHDVTLVTRPDTARQPRNPFAFYGLPPAPGLRFEVVPAASNAHAHRVRFLLSALEYVRRHQNAIIYTRDLGLAAFLLQIPSSERPRLAYESHGIAPVMAAEIPKLLGKPGLEPSERKLRRLDRREARVWKRAPTYITITRALADDLTARYGSRERVDVVPDGASPVEPCPDRAGGSRPVAAYAGHLYPWKGVDVFVRALARTPEVDGLIVGGHPEEPDLGRVQAILHMRGLADRVRITGLLPPADVAAQLCEADILVLPNTPSATSERYTSPLKLFEYLMLGRAIVASDLPSIREILTDGRNARLVPAGDADALAAALAELAASPDTAAALGAGARAIAPDYTWDARAERLEQAFK